MQNCGQNSLFLKVIFNLGGSKIKVRKALFTFPNSLSVTHILSSASCSHIIASPLNDAIFRLEPVIWNCEVSSSFGRINHQPKVDKRTLISCRPHSLYKAWPRQVCDFILMERARTAVKCRLQQGGSGLLGC